MRDVNPETTTGLRHVKILRPLAIRDFALLWTGAAVSLLGAPLHAPQRLVVEEHRDAVAAEPDVELHAVAAPDPGRRDERLERVLRRRAPVAAVRESERRSGPRLHLPQPNRSCAAIPR